jgi:hypothetical protein
VLASKPQNVPEIIADFFKKASPALTLGLFIKTLLLFAG